MIDTANTVTRAALSESHLAILPPQLILAMSPQLSPSEPLIVSNFVHVYLLLCFV